MFVFLYDLTTKQMQQNSL